MPPIAFARLRSGILGASARPSVPDLARSLVASPRSVVTVVVVIGGSGAADLSAETLLLGRSFAGFGWELGWELAVNWIWTAFVCGIARPTHRIGRAILLRVIEVPLARAINPVNGICVFHHWSFMAHEQYSGLDPFPSLFASFP